MAGEGQGDAEGLSFRLLEEIVDDSFTGTHEALLGKPIGALLLRHADGVYRGAGRMVAAHGKYVADPSLSVEIEDGTVRGSFDNIPFGSRTARSDEAEHLGLWARLIYRQDKPGTSPRFIDVVPAVPPGVAVSVVHPIPAPSLEVAVVEPVTPPPTPPVPPPTPVPAPSLEPSSGRYVLVPREGVVPDKALLEADPDRYLAQGIELRLREWYDAGTDRFRLPHVAGTYQPREELPYNLVRAILERATSTGEFGRLKKDHRLMRYRDVSDGCVALEDVLALHFIKISDAKKYGVDDIARFFGVAEEDIIFLGSEKGYFPSSTREKQSYLVQQAFRDALHTAFDAMVQGKSLFSESQLTSIPFVDLSAQAYDPNRLVTALWVIYQATGCTPDQTEIIDQALMQLFHSQHMRLVPVETQGVYASRYRAGDFTDAHFSALGKTAREVLTDPYACERNPDEEIGRTHIARELGLSKYSAGRLFRKAVQDTGTTLTVDLATRKRARRGDIHKALGLPGWFPGDAPSTSSVAVPAVPAVSEEQRGELEEAVAEEPAEPEQARSVPPPSLASSLDAVVAQIGPASPPASVSEPVSLSTYEVSLAASLQQRLVAEGYYRSADRNVVLGEGVSYAYDHTLSLAPAAAYLGIASDNLRLTLKNHGFPPRKIRASTVLKMKLWREGLDGKFSSHHLASDELAALFGATSNLIAQCNGADLFTPTEKANKPKHAGHFQTVQRRVFYRVFDTALEGLLAGSVETDSRAEPTTAEQASDSVAELVPAPSLDTVVAQAVPASPSASLSEPVSLSTYEASLAASLQHRLVAEGYYRPADHNVVIAQGVSYAHDQTINRALAAPYLDTSYGALFLLLKKHGFSPKPNASTFLKIKLWRQVFGNKSATQRLDTNELATLFGTQSDQIMQYQDAGLFTPKEGTYKPKDAARFQVTQRRVFYRVFDTALEGLLAGSVETDSRAEPTTAEQASDSVAELVPAPASSSPALAPSPALDLETRAASAPIPPDPILSDSAPLYQCDPEAYLAGHLKARLAQKEYHKFGEDGTHYLLLKSTQYYRADHVFPLPNAVSLFPIERLPLERFVEGLGKPEVHGVTARDLALFLLGNTKMKRINNETTPRVIASAFSHLYGIPEGEDDAVTHILGLSDSNRKKNYVAFQCDLFYRVGRKVIDDLLSEEAPAPAPSSPAPASVAEPETTPTPDHDGDAQALEELSATLSEMKARVAKLKPLDVEKIPVLDWTSFDKGHGDLQTLLSTLKQEREQPPAQELSDLAVEEPSSPTPSSRSAVPEPALVFDNQYATAYLAESLRTRILNEGHFHAVQRRIKLPNGELYSLSRYLDVGRVSLATKISASRVHEFVNRYKLSEANGIPVSNALKILLWAQVVKIVDPLTLESHAQLYGVTPKDMQKVHTLTTLFVPKTADIAPEDQKKAIKDRQREVYFDVFRVALDVLTYERSVERVLHLEGNATEVFAQATVGQIDASSLSSSSSSSASVAGDKPEPVLRQPTLEMIRVTPPLVDGYYDYGLQVPLTYEAQRDPLSAFVQAYAPEFARRMLEAFVEEGYLTHAGFVLGHKREGRKQVVDFDRFVPLLTFLDFMPGTRDQVAGAITTLVPRNLRNSTAKTLEVHSYAAAVLCYNPLQNKRPRDKFTLDLALEAWYIAGHKRDVQLATFLEATPLVLSPRGLSGSYLTNEKFFDVYYPLAMRWAQTMHNDATRKHLMEEVGYVDETGFSQMLVEQGVASDKAYSAITQVKPSQLLLDMVHTRDVPAIAKTLKR